MAPTASEKSPEPDGQERHSVLAELPHTRPQRVSARRESARKRVGTSAPRQEASKPQTPSKSKTPQPSAGHPQTPTQSPRPKATSRTKPKPSARRQTVKPPTPPQGYEADSDLTGTPVSPPSGTEVLGAFAELAGELAHTGVAAGGRLLRSTLSRLSGS
ncbi:MAG: hypothetical protein WB698_11940 [Solirubrobacteraceae bacterium]